MLVWGGIGHVSSPARRSRPGWYPARLLHPSWSRLGGKEMQERWQPDLGHAKPGGKGLPRSEAGERDSQVGKCKEADVPVDLWVERCLGGIGVYDLELGIRSG